MIEFYEIQDLSSPNGKPKLLFYDYSCYFFFLQPIAEGNCEKDIDTYNPNSIVAIQYRSNSKFMYPNDLNVGMYLVEQRMKTDF